ncbi:MAG: DUF2721 domain-containing protein [Isosphaeraceae bacterium]
MPATIAGPSYVTLSAMISPALFLTATGSLIISTSNRMSRIVDRIRVLNELGDRLDRGITDLDYPEARAAHVEEQLGELEWRSDRVRIALTLLYSAFCAFVGTSLELAGDVLLGSRIGPLATLTAVVGVMLLLVASTNLVREALWALKSNRREVRFHRSLQARRHAARTDQAKDVL